MFYVEIFTSLLLIRGKGWVLNTEGNREKKGRTAGSPGKGLWGLSEVLVNLFPVRKPLHLGEKFKLLLLWEFLAFITPRAHVDALVDASECTRRCQLSLPEFLLALCRADRLLCAKNKKAETETLWRRSPRAQSRSWNVCTGNKTVRHFD